MQKLYSFDKVHDAIRVYRKLMDALSNPGKRENIMDGIGDFGEENKAFLAIAATLLDAEVSFFANDDSGLMEKIKEITHSDQVDISEADYIFISSELEDSAIENIFSGAKCGTFSDPHTSATVILMANSKAYMDNVVALLKKRGIEYPLGIDLMFILNEVELVAVPRLIKGVI